MGRYLRVSDEAEEELLAIIRQRMSFDQGSSLALGREIFAKARELLDSPLRYRKVFTVDEIEHRCFTHKSVTVFYFINDEFIEITRIFGPGRNWQEEL